MRVMAEQEKYLFVFILFVIFVHTKAQLNVTIPPPPPLVFTLAPNCRDHDGNVHQIGDVWKPSDLSTCTCTGPQQIECHISLPPLTFKPIILSCIDGQQNTRQPGEVWLEDPKTNCSCTQNNLVRCGKLPDPVCLDASGNFRQNFETWLNGSCVECACVNGSINCTRYDVNITYGLYKVAEYPTCQQCDIPTKTAMALSSCKAFRDNRAMLTECALRGLYIRNIHRCNGIDECPDGSDEKDCGKVNCKDEEGGTLLIKDQNGWKVSKCLSCRCNAGLATCKRTLTINFPGFFNAFYQQEGNCTQPSCKVLKFIRENRERCEGVELLKDRGIIFQGQTWKSGGCSFYHPGFSWSRQCAVMTRPICYVYNGHICCASQCPALQEMKNQMRGNLTFCSNGRQLESSSLQCRGANNCLQNLFIQNCSSEVTCQDEDSNQYFEEATWSVGACMECSCVGGKIQCSRKVVFVSFLNLTPNTNQLASDLNFMEHCNQPECNVARYMKTNKGVCNACRWNDKLYYDGDHWKENGVDFYCLTTDQRVRPGCYIENTRVTCTGAIPGIRKLSLISKNGLFLCESGDEIRSLSDKCNIKQECDDASDERNCDNYYCPYEMAHGFLWNRTQVGRQVLKQCSLVSRTWTGTFGSNCTQDYFKTFWLHNTTCYCEKKALMEYFKKKITSVNTTNLWNVSNELANSAKAKEFTNPRVFHDLYKELFFIATTRLLRPITHQNADTALQYCNSVLDTVLSSPVYGVHIFCKAKLVYDRNLLAEKALEFLRQAPNDTQAYFVGSTLQIRYVQDDIEKLPSVTDNFRPEPGPVFAIPRIELNLQLNTAPLVPAVTEKPAVIVIPSTNNVTRNNNTNSNDTRIPQKNVTNELTNKQIKDRLRENNCTRVMFDEEKGVFLYDTGVSKEYLKHEKIQSNMELVLLCISIAAIVLALVLLTFLRLKKSERLFIHKSLLFSLGVGNLVFVLDKTSFATRQEHAALCSAVAVIQHYLSTAVFTWMLVEGINLYIKLVRVFSVKKQYIVYMLIGWGIPAVIVGLVAAIRPSTFDMSKTPTTDVTCGALKLTAEVERTRCWINGSLWIYKGPILVILVVNLVLFVILLRVIFGKIASKYANNHVTATRRGLRSIVALLPLLGVTWLVGFFVEFHYGVGYLFILLSSTQGVAFFIFHCVLDDQVRDAFRKFRDKSQLPSKTRETPASNPNTTPILERNSRVNILEQSVDEGTTRDLVITNKTTGAEETHL